MPSPNLTNRLFTKLSSVLRICGIAILCLVCVVSYAIPAPAGGPDIRKSLPTLKDTVKNAVELHSESDKSLVEFEVSKAYYQLLARREQLGISNEVRGHFETAVTKADERMESDDGDVSQSAITKLKLGLSGTLNDISNFEAGIQRARHRLEYWTGMVLDEEGDVSDEGLVPIKFPYEDHNAYQKVQGITKPLSGKALLEIQEAFIDINKSREKLELARKSRKITRALLVTEVANYDFGIGDEADLFEALIIYTKVLVGYYDTILQFNLSALDVKKRFAQIP